MEMRHAAYEATVTAMFLLLPEMCMCRVAVRVRPASAREAKQTCLLQLDKTSLKFLGPECFSNTFSFDAIFEQQDPQDRIFYDVESIVLSVLQGFNGTICAYGQTGTLSTLDLPHECAC